MVTSVSLVILSGGPRSGPESKDLGAGHELARHRCQRRVRAQCPLWRFSLTGGNDAAFSGNWLSLAAIRPIGFWGEMSPNQLLVENAPQISFWRKTRGGAALCAAPARVFRLLVLMACADGGFAHVHVRREGGKRPLTDAR